MGIRTALVQASDMLSGGTFSVGRALPNQSFNVASGYVWSNGDTPSMAGDVRLDHALRQTPVFWRQHSLAWDGGGIYPNVVLAPALASFDVTQTQQCMCVARQEK